MDIQLIQQTNVYVYSLMQFSYARLIIRSSEELIGITELFSDNYSIVVKILYLCENSEISMIEVFVDYPINIPYSSNYQTTSLKEKGL